MQPVSNNLIKLSAKLFDSSESQSEFQNAVVEGRSDLQAIAWLKPRPEQIPFTILPRNEWQPDFVDVIAAGERPGAHVLHEQGAYYCLDLSSVFEASILRGVPETPKVILDVCASPGGKSILAATMLKPESLIANEVIKKRIGAMSGNFRRCSVAAQIISRDSTVIAEEYPSRCDVVIVDAPCSGQSLVARGEKAPSCFHFATINMNSNRQKRIIANSSAAVAAGGYLAYMTCTYSIQENEAVIEWFLKRFPDFESVEVPLLNFHRSKLSEIFGYRLFPQEGMGAGGFTSLLKRKA